MLKLSLQGDQELINKLRELTKSEFKTATQIGAKKALEPVQKTARAIAPKETGKLRRAIRVRVLKRSKKRVGARVTVGNHDSMFKGRRYYAAFQEYGWKLGKRANNQDLGIAKRKRRTSAQREEIKKLNSGRKQVRGQRFLYKAMHSNWEIVAVMYRRYVRDGIKTAMARSSMKKFKKF
jgi:HK97 gp10 family phage protein